MKTIEKILTVGGVLTLALSITHCGSNNTSTDMKAADMTVGPDLSMDMTTFAPPVITSISPSGALNNVATQITITGTGFRTGTTVTVGGMTCANPTITATTVVCTVPIRATTCGPSVVVVTNADAQVASSAAGFRYVSSMTAFAAATPASVATGMSPGRVYVADFNKDGKSDLVTPNKIGNSASVLLGNGDQTFKPAVNLTTMGATTINDVTTGDFNNDGNLDVVTGNQTNNITFYAGNGDGSFKAGANIGVAAGVSFIAAGDVSGDGKPDIVFNGGAVNNYVLVSNGDGTFKAGVPYASASAVGALTLTDVSGDGKFDIVTANTAGTTSVLVNNGDGTFKAFIAGPAAGTTPSGMVGVDLNNDQKNDLVIANRGSSNLSIAIGNGDGTFKAPSLVNVGGQPDSLFVTDVNGDGLLDAVTANQLSTSWSFLAGIAGGTFSAGVATATAAGSGPFGVTATDINGDKLPDVVVTAAGPSTALLFNQQCK